MIQLFRPTPRVRRTQPPRRCWWTSRPVSNWPPPRHRLRLPPQVAFKNELCWNLEFTKLIFCTVMKTNDWELVRFLRKKNVEFLNLRIKIEILKIDTESFILDHFWWKYSESWKFQSLPQKSQYFKFQVRTTSSIFRRIVNDLKSVIFRNFRPRRNSDFCRYGSGCCKFRRAIPRSGSDRSDAFLPGQPRTPDQPIRTVLIGNHEPRNSELLIFPLFEIVILANDVNFNILWTINKVLNS